MAEDDLDSRVGVEQARQHQADGVPGSLSKAITPQSAFG
jgi:hypothetical protein